jgi:hypothetical protein
MNAALLDLFLAQLPESICKTYKPIHMKQPNTVFLHMSDWFIGKYGKTTTEDRKENLQRMAADWHPSDGFEPLAMRLFIGAPYASAARYPMEKCVIINTGLCIIKCCGMYSKEYKGWIAWKSELPPVTKTVKRFKNYWSKAITLVNQMASVVLRSLSWKA